MNINTSKFKYMRFNCFPILPAILCAMTCSAASPQVTTPGAMPERWLYTEGLSQTVPSDDDWWHSFGDPMLDSLIAMGVENNYDLSQAMRRIEMSNQQLRSIRSGYYPTLGVSGSYSAARMSGVTTSHKTDASTQSYFNVGADMQWQIDIFGKLKERTMQGKAALNASRAEYDAMMVTVSGKIATAYMQLRALQAQMQVLDIHIAQQKRVLDITTARHDAGLASMLDVTQARTTYLSTQAGMTSTDIQIATTINAIATLVGCYPSQISSMLREPRPMPDHRRIVAVGIPADLLRRRPDIAEAEYTLAGYAAALGVAKKDFLPTLSLSGQVGTSAHDIGDMFSERSFTYSIAPTLSWTIFDGMARDAAREEARHQMLAGIDNYNATVLAAVQEVENAMVTYTNSVKYIDMISEVTAEANRAFDLSIDLYKQGLTNFINVTQSEITYLQYANELVTAKGETLKSLVNLYEALGGGWEGK